ncbi:MAG: L-threonylcarbamoyladenylate synthase [Bacteroidota bacterium]
MFEQDKLENISRTLDRGGIILYPTDTVWGLGCDACNESAVNRLFDLKQRERAKSFVLLVDSLEMLRDYVEEVHPRIDTLLHYHQRPLTVVYPRAKNLPKGVVAPDGSIGIRIVQDDFCRRLIQDFGRPLVATSANISDQPFSGCFGNVSSAIITHADYVVKYRQHEKNTSEPSVMVKVDEDGELVFLRN